VTGVYGGGAPSVGVGAAGVAPPQPSVAAQTIEETTRAWSEIGMGPEG
jgi:hypothetical protein